MAPVNAAKEVSQASLHWRKDPRTFALFHCGPFSMADHFMPAGVPSFPQITEVRNVGADGDGNSVSGSLCACFFRKDK